MEEEGSCIPRSVLQGESPFTKVTREFLKVPETPIHSIDEVMVAYKGTRAGNLRQYVAKKPDKWGFKLFCRSSVDGVGRKYLRSQYGLPVCGHCQENRVGHPPLTSVKEMNKKRHKGGHWTMSSDGILVARWKDNSVVTIVL
ncbi:uncharacterized protein LOC135222405 [Macrobrachium nipponense]|uniref:uncharacterized protein LOC135222405 n=1 Tax=Macrobrachium nipponense TaxID=159736 RepID=UPI0030C80AB4